METLIALFAVLISYYVLVRTRLMDDRLVKLEQEHTKLGKLLKQILRRDEEERKRCHVTSHWYRGKNNSDRIEIMNDGEDSAYKIRFNFKPHIRSAAPGTVNAVDDSFPIGELEPGDKRIFLISRPMKMESDWRPIMFWANGAGEKYEENVVQGE